MRMEIPKSCAEKGFSAQRHIAAKRPVRGPAATTSESSDIAWDSLLRRRRRAFVGKGFEEAARGVVRGWFDFRLRCYRAVRLRRCGFDLFDREGHRSRCGRHSFGACPLGRTRLNTRVTGRLGPDVTLRPRERPQNDRQDSS